jgi:serine/threonine-protein kinase RsbT
MAGTHHPREIALQVSSDSDILIARRNARAMASKLSFTSADSTLIATAISELARNIVQYAGHGEIQITGLADGPRSGIEIVAHDNGPGIPDISKAVRDGYSTSGRLGLGLSGVKRLMDEFRIVSEVDVGTTVTVKKWVRRKSEA